MSGKPMTAASDATEVASRFWEKVDKDGDCWLWTGTVSNGYGSFWDGTRTWRAHRWSYVALRGEIPAGLQLDHLCRVRSCVNPAHLEPVTLQENVRRGEAGKHFRDRAEARTHCIHGHEFTPENTIAAKAGRQCRECIKRHKRNSRNRRRGLPVEPLSSPDLTPGHDRFCAGLDPVNAGDCDCAPRCRTAPTTPNGASS